MHETRRSNRIFTRALSLALLVALAALPALAAGPAKGKAPGASAAAKEAETPAVPKKGKFIASENLDVPSDAPQGHHDWRWHLLTYPGTSIPPHPYTTAKAWEREHVPDAPRWARAAEGLPAPEADGSGRAATPVDAGAWTFLGPRPIHTTGYGKVTGRFNAVAVDPRTVGTPGQIKALAGAASGGLWLTTNCCGASTTWTSALDDEQLVTQAVGAITFDPTNPDVIYVGTGDFNAADQFGEGLLRSTDGGQTWTQLAVDVFTPNAPGTPYTLNQNTGVIAVDPNNPATLLAGTRFELFISHDAGTTWARVPFGANQMDPTKPMDDPANTGKAINRISGIYLDGSTTPTTAFVAVGYHSSAYNGDNGVYRGTLPAAGLPALSLVKTGWPTTTGNGTNGGSQVGRIRLGASRGNAGGSLSLYAQVQSTSTYGALGTYLTRDGGNTWTLLTGTTDSTDTQDWYDLFILVDPGDDKRLYVGRQDLYLYQVNTAYTSATKTSMGGYSGFGLHPDQHWATWITGTGGTGQYLLGNDGGLYHTQLTSPTAWTHTSLSTTVNATQWYAGQIGRDFAQVGGTTPQFLFAGAQDNGTSSWDSGEGSFQWRLRNGGDGMFAAFDPFGSITTGYWFGEYYNGATYRSAGGADGPYSTHDIAGSGDRKAWSSPLRLDPYHCKVGNCSNLIFGSQYLYATGTGGDGARLDPGWKKCGNADLTKGQGSLISLNVAPSDPKAVVVGTDDGSVQVSTNVYVNASGLTCTQAAANSASFGCAPNVSATWTNLTQSNAVLPNRVVMGVSFDPTTTNKVYAAVGGFNSNTPTTPGHLFRCVNSGGTWTWQDKSGNLPDVPAESVAVNPNDPRQVFLGTDIGFYYTADIEAQPPLWYRYNYGLPTTVIAYLNLDRGPESNPYASTTLAAFTYGRGTYAIRLPGSSGFPPHPVPPTLRAEREGASVDLSFEVAQCGNPTHNLYYGSLGNFSAVVGGQCGLGNSGTATVALPDNVWFVVAGADPGAAPGSVVSHFGTDSAGQLRSFTGWASVGGCSNYSQQNTTTTCP